MEGESNNINDENVQVDTLYGNDKESTIAYEMEKNLKGTLERLSEISSEMISSITTEYSDNEIAHSVLKYLPSGEMELEKERSYILSDLRQYVSDDCSSNNDENN